MTPKNKTVLITGSSTGIGRSTVFAFQKAGWNVIATMRTPEKEKEFGLLKNVHIFKLDVTDSKTIQSAISEGISKFGSIDAIVNNAGYGLTGPFEGTSPEQIQRQFNTNVFGLMAVVKAILPHFREKKSGTIINVASMGGRITFPLYSIYHGTKWAVEGFSESLRFELEPLGIKIKIIEPGAIKTDFYDRSVDTTLDKSPEIYKNFSEKAFKKMNAAGEKGASPDLVAKTILKAASDKSSKLRYPVGSDAKSLTFLRRFLTDSMYAKIVRLAVLS
jgi:short-subunit dehydrogenase